MPFYVQERRNSMITILMFLAVLLPVLLKIRIWLRALMIGMEARTGVGTVNGKLTFAQLAGLAGCQSTG